MLKVPADTDPNGLADWIECSLLLQRRIGKRISETAVLSAFERAEIPDPEGSLADLKNRIRNRMRLLRESYPVNYSNRMFSIIRRWSTCLPYQFLLLVSLNQTYKELRYTRGQANRPAEIFEEITEIAVQRYLGGQSIRIGAPRRQPVPAQLPRAVKYAAERINEEFGYGELEIHGSGDDGLDLIVWVPFPDRKPSQLIVLIQCAIGTDWQTKRSELSLQVWQRHIRWHTGPLKAFSVPFALDAGPSWLETASRGGLVLDRTRLAAIIGRSSLHMDLRKRTQDWCRSRLEHVKRLRA